MFIGSIGKDFLTIDHISPPIYIDNNTEGYICSFIDLDSFKTENPIGVHCDDCNAGNTIEIGKDYNGNKLNEIIVEEADIDDYSITYDYPHIYWLEVKLLPTKQVNEVFWTFMFGVSIFIFLYIGRIMVKMTSEGVDF
jgi:hypothetical protein